MTLLVVCTPVGAAANLVDVDAGAVVAVGLHSRACRLRSYDSSPMHHVLQLELCAGQIIASNREYLESLFGFIQRVSVH